MRSSIESLPCASWLVYAPRATDDAAKRVKNLILDVKTDRVNPDTRTPIVRVMVERAMARLSAEDRRFFDGHPMLVPVPGSGLTKPNTVWPAKRVCEELVAVGLGHDVSPVLVRSTAVEKSAGSAHRPSLDVHVHSLTARPGFTMPARLIVVDDVVTAGTTMMACAMKLAEAYPNVPVTGFALSRTQSQGNPPNVFLPVIERIHRGRPWCARA